MCVRICVCVCECVSVCVLESSSYEWCVVYGKAQLTLEVYTTPLGMGQLG